MPEPGPVMNHGVLDPMPSAPKTVFGEATSKAVGLVGGCLSNPDADLEPQKH